ncbi:MAG: toll/interleukin-1 receptor domain-containing protein [Thiocapsa sp.]|jgi:hypothetical protein|nr:toll/interleukin-1 receptor domain-containing protein [Thiocapsa sp.]MCG6984269.1 toll/interleukin-1 receptor domain-containing protein [Thiocapsa sp.]
MKIFVSYASEQKETAERIYLKLVNVGHDVFFDRRDLQPGHAFDAKIKDRIEGADLCVFILSPESVEPGSYALTELDLVRRKWPSPEGRVLVVDLGNLEGRDVPPYLRSNIYLSPAGDAAAETFFAVQRMAERLATSTPAESGRHIRAAGQGVRWMPSAVFAVAVAVAVAIGLWAVYQLSQGPDQVINATGGGVAAGGGISVGGNLNIEGAERAPEAAE